MLIAFEGTDHKGRLEAADQLSAGHAVPKLTRSYYSHALQVDRESAGVVQCFDGIGWLSHMVHQLAAGPAPALSADTQSVFVMPETHLVFKLFRPGEEPTLAEARTLPDMTEVHTAPNWAVVNQVYTSMAHTLMALNEARDFALFKTVTIAQSFVDPLDGATRIEVMEFSSPLQSPWHRPLRARLVQDDLSLFDMLSEEDAQL